MNQSDKIDELATALAKARPKFGAIKKTQTGQIGKQQYRYADIHDVLAAVILPLSEHGLTICQDTVSKDGHAILQTTIMHESGQWVRSNGTPVYVDTTGPINAMQQLGKSQTYARRYDLSAMLALATEDDTDGQGSPEKAPPKRAPDKKSSLNPATYCTYGKNAGVAWADMRDAQLRWYALEKTRATGETDDDGEPLREPDPDFYATAVWEQRQADLAELNDQDSQA